MKARPRGVENLAAGQMNKIFIGLGMSPVERIPVLGREGPDITINESGLAVDVKSRIEVPKLLWKSNKGHQANRPVLRQGGLLCVRLANLGCLYGDVSMSEDQLPGSKLVSDWLQHMAAWANPEGKVPAIVCHRPGMHTANAVFVMYAHDLDALRYFYSIHCGGSHGTTNS